MIINYDRSRITVSDKELMCHGYAEEDYHSIRLSFEYTEQQKRENRMQAESCDDAKWSEICKDSALMRSRYMEAVIDKIASSFLVFNLSAYDVHYDSDGWDFYFWCNDFFNTCSGHGLSGNDYSHTTLTFNKRQNLSHRMDLCTRFLELVEKEFSDLENLKIDIQYGAMVYEKEIEKSAAALVDSLDGKRFTMDGTFHQSMFGFGLKGDGRLVKSDGKLYWMKKYAKNRGYLMSPIDILRISWATTNMDR